MSKLLIILIIIALSSVCACGDAENRGEVNE